MADIEEVVLWVRGMRVRAAEVHWAFLSVDEGSVERDKVWIVSKVFS